MIATTIAPKKIVELFFMLKKPFPLDSEYRIGKVAL